MKKLKIKVFWVIFSLLTTFTFIIFTTSTIRTYIDRQKNISDMLTKIPIQFDNKKPEFNPSKNVPKNEERRIFLDFNIYTIILDDEGNYKELINHTFDEKVNEKQIKKVANSIIKSHKENLYIGNLYTTKYSYNFTPNNTLIIMDNSKVNKVLIKDLFSNILLFLLCEVVILIITYLITKWIITPVKESFEKQKTFVADASHELKTPLAVMIASSDAYFNDKDEKWVKNIKNEAVRMTKLVTELLDLAKTEEIDIMMKENNLSEIVESSILTFESLFYENKIELKYDITKDINMLCNENLIVELISILVDNAIKHTDNKGKVLVNLYKNNKQIILEVKNKGLPIKKEDEEKIFERFYKVDSSRNRNSNNYGLGLAIAKNIVERHNGKISAYSSNGYTTFKVIWNQK